MDNRIIMGMLVGLIGSLTFATTNYVRKSHKFNKTLKWILTLLAVIPPVQWVIILLVLFFKSFDTFNSESENKLRTSKASINDLIDLKNKGFISENEFKQKVEKLEADKIDLKIKQSDEYRKLKGLLESKVLTEEEFNSKVRMLYGVYSHNNNFKSNDVEHNIKEDFKENYKEEKKPFLNKLIDLFSFEGRITASVFLIRMLLSFLFYIFLTISHMFLFSRTKNYEISAFLSLILMVLYLWFWFAQGAKRCHDLGKSGWWQLIPFYILWMLFQKGDYFKNQYGNPVN